MADNGVVRSGSWVFRRTFTLSLAAALYVVIAFVWATIRARLPGFLSPVLGTLVGGAAALVLSVVSVRMVRQRYSHFLDPLPGVGAREGLASIILWCLPTYPALVLLVGVLAYCVVPREGHQWPIVVYGLAVWGSAWLCVPPATSLAWWRGYQRSTAGS